MSSHSRSSSEVESIQFSEVLPKLIEAFFKDFSFSDIKDSVKDLFTTDEFAAIIQEKDERCQIFRLFWVLCAKESIIPKFLDKLLYDYKWLSDLVKQERSNPSKGTEQYVDALKMLRSSNQKHTDFNVHRMDLFIKLRHALKKLKSYENVVLLGDLGTGKKWLALDVCSEYTVMRAMDFKIYWIDVSQCTSPEEDLRMLQQFRLLLADSTELSPAASGTIYHNRPNSENFDSISNRILELQQQLRAKLRTERFKNCLLVLMNVQNIKTWKAFDLGCKILLTTRNKNVNEYFSPKLSEHLTMDDGVTLTEYYALFERYLKCSRNQFPPNATDIYYNSKGHPQLLSIIAQSLRQKKSDWNEWIRNLQNLEINDNKFTTVIEMSLNNLKELLALYAVFAIFPHSIAIPVKLLGALWNKSLQETKRIAHEFHNNSFVNEDVLPDNTIVYTVPLVYSSHLKASKSIQSLINNRELHTKVIEYYKLENTFKNSTELELCNSHHDMYFFYCIGYHLREADCKEMFPYLYLNYIFLEQKMRAVGLLNTIADLKFYEEEIAGVDPRRRALLADLRDFLPKIEEKLVHSKDTCLLQYALMANGNVYEEALQQVKRFPHKVWFTEKGNFHRRRQIVNLPYRAKIVHFLEQDTCLIVLDDNNMLLADISLDYNNGPVYLVNAENKDTIIEARLFRSDNYVLALDKRGKLKLWSITDERRRSLIHRTGSKQKVNPLNFTQSAKMQIKKCKQSIHESTIGKRGKIVAFHVEQLPVKYEINTFLHVAFDSGDVCVFEWDSDREEFRHARHVPVLPTRFRDIRFLCKILDKYYMLLNTAGNINFWNLRESSLVPVSFEWPKHTSSLIGYEVYTSEIYGGIQHTCIIFAFRDKILRLTFGQQKFAVLKGSLETLYEVTDIQCSITCAKLSRDGRYLVLGTKHGLIVFDTLSKSEILRSNVSEAISCVDIYGLDDQIFKYIIVCGSEHKTALNIFALRKTADNSIGWSHNVSCLGNEESNDPQLEPDVWLVGNKLYDITYEDGTLFLVAADSKNRVHQVCTTNTKIWSIIMPTETAHRLTAITTYKQHAFAGYANGEIFNLNQETVKKFTESAINYLQLMDDSILVASTHGCQPKTSISNFVDGSGTTVEIDTKHCFKIFEHYLLLVNEFGIVLILDIHNNLSLAYSSDDVRSHEVGAFALSGCDYQNGHLFLVTSTYNIYIYSLSNNQDKLTVNKCPVFSKNDIVESRVTCLAASSDGSLIAVGLANGNIELWKAAENRSLSFLYLLQSHVSQIYDMKFSPHMDVLVSCSEQLCFWHIAYVLNNPLTTHTFKRRSSRFSSTRSQETEEVDAQPVHAQSSNRYLHVNGIGVDVTTALQSLQVNGGATAPNAWRNKQGPFDKPELLACIKFDGNKAEKLFANADFTQFNTIDDEGVYYHLTLLDLDSAIAAGTPMPAAESSPMITTERIYSNGHEYVTDSSGMASETSSGDDVPM